MRYRVTFTKVDGSVEVHEHLTDIELVGLGLKINWTEIKRVDMERED